MLWRFAKPACRVYLSKVLLVHLFHPIQAMSYIVPLSFAHSIALQSKRGWYEGSPSESCCSTSRYPEGHVAHRSTVSSWLGWDMIETHHTSAEMKCPGVQGGWNQFWTGYFQLQFTFTARAPWAFLCGPHMSLTQRISAEMDQDHWTSLNYQKAIISKCRKTIKATWIHIGDMIVMICHDSW